MVIAPAASCNLRDRVEPSATAANSPKTTSSL
jgi:hypothetical protein